MQFVCWLVARANNWGHITPLNLNRILRTAFGAWLGFFAIGLVLWGIYTGKFSPTEAAAVTVGFCVIVGVLSRWLYPLVARGMEITKPADDEKEFIDLATSKVWPKFYDQIGGVEVLNGVLTSLGRDTVQSAPTSPCSESTHVCILETSRQSGKLHLPRAAGRVRHAALRADRRPTDVRLFDHLDRRAVGHPVRLVRLFRRLLCRADGGA
jgi:hypothetical protein